MLIINESSNCTRPRPYRTPTRPYTSFDRVINWTPWAVVNTVLVVLPIGSSGAHVMNSLRYLRRGKPQVPAPETLPVGWWPQKLHELLLHKQAAMTARGRHFANASEQEQHKWVNRCEQYKCVWNTFRISVTDMACWHQRVTTMWTTNIKEKRAGHQSK